MRISLGYSGSTALPLTLDAVTAADAAGLDGIWSAEHVGLNDAVVPSAVYAARTRRLEVGLVGLNPDTRHPGVLAMELATLNTIAAGRLRIQVGTGSPVRARALGITSARTVGDVGEFVSALRALLAGESVSTTAALFALDGLRLSVPDRPAPIPIDVMAIRPRMTELATRIADGISLSIGASRHYLADRVETISALLAAAGRSRAEFRISAMVLGCITDDLDTARAGLGAVAATFPLASIPELTAGLDLPDPETLAATLRERGPAGAGALFSDDAIDGLGLVATPDTVSDAVERYRATGIDELIVVSVNDVEDQPHFVRLLASTRRHGA